MNALRDWGHARDYVEAQWLILQHHEPTDFVIATGVQHSVREFVEIAARMLEMNISWKGTGVDEYGVDEFTDKIVVRVDKRYFRPAEVDTLLGDASKARAALKWAPKTSFEGLVREMVQSDLRLAENEVRTQAAKRA
jgi:GDPmannose 4,6-dehydratase